MTAENRLDQVCESLKNLGVHPFYITWIRSRIDGDIADTADAFRDDFDDGDIETCIARTLNEIFEMGRDHYDGIGA